MPTINPYADVIEFPPGTPTSVINTILQINAANRARQSQPAWWETGLANLLNQGSSQLLFPWLKNELVNIPYESEIADMKTQEAIELAEANAEIARRKIADDRAYTASREALLGSGVNEYLGYQQPQEIQGPPEPPRVSPNFSQPELQVLQELGPSLEQTPTATPKEMMGELGATGQAPIESITTPQQAGLGTKPGATPVEALRLLAGARPEVAALLIDALKNQNFFATIDPLQTAKREADITAKLQSAATAQTTAEKNLAAAEQSKAKVQEILQLIDPRQANLEARTRSTGADAALKELKVEILNSLPPEERSKWLIKPVNELTGMLDGVATQLYEIRNNPETAALPKDAQMRMAMEKDRARQVGLRGSGAYAAAQGGIMGKYDSGYQNPPTGDITVHRQMNTLANRLGEIEDLVPKVRLEKIMGGLRPWLNELEKRWATNPNAPIPQLMEFLPGGRTELSHDELQFLTRLENYADAWIRARTGAQASFPELRSVRSFMPVVEMTPQAFKAVLSSTGKDLDQDFESIYQQWGDFRFNVPQQSQQDAQIRRWLRGQGASTSSANVKKVRSNPEALKRALENGR